MSRVPRRLPRVLSSLLLFSAVVSAGPSVAAEPDVAKSKDHALLTRMQEMHIVAYRANPFDAFAFRTGKGKTEAVEGQLYEIRYTANAGAPVPTPVAIHRNHQQAIRTAGGTVVFEDARYTTLKVAKDGMETWAQVDTAWGKGYMLTIVEKKAMVQEVVASLEAFRAGLGTAGHVEVPGVFFDSGKAALEPASAASIAEVAKLLRADPGLKVFVVGHTDAVADVAFNLKLSQARAEAVVRALVAEHGIAPGRLLAHGAGPFAPVASNADEAGRAKNRRVELVKQ